MSNDVSENLKIAVLGLDIANGDPQQSLQRARRAVFALPPDTELAVLPELFTTAFISDIDELRRVCTPESTELTVSNLLQWAKETGMALAGSFSACQDGCFLNRAFFITPQGQTTFYDKKHLFTLSTEYKTYTPGTEMWPVVSFRGWNIALTICYELRFPVWQRNVGHRYDMMLVPANWPDVRRYAWEHLLIARAIENQAVYVGADRSGTDPYGIYTDMCRVYDHMGKPLGEPFGAGGTPALTAAPSLKAVRDFRVKLPVIDAADHFEFI